MDNINFFMSWWPKELTVCAVSSELKNSNLSKTGQSIQGRYSRRMRQGAKNDFSGQNTELPQEISKLLKS